MNSTRALRMALITIDGRTVPALVDRDTCDGERIGALIDTDGTWTMVPVRDVTVIA